MQKVFRAVLLSLLLTCGAIPQVVGGADVVANGGVKESPMRRVTVRAIFYGTITRWDNGRPIVVFVLPPDHPASKDFAWNVLNVTPYSFEEKISSMVATRDGNPPHVLNTEMEMLRAVASTPNSIGYLSSFIVVNNASNNLRVVPVL
jgi:ABC-type phosphate transport system substrate-binding protein